MLFRSHIDLCFLSIGLSLCFTWLSSRIAFVDRFVRWARNLKALKKKSRVKKCRSQIAWGRGSWFPLQATVWWIEVFMQTAPYNILRIAQTTWSHQPRFFRSMVISIRNSQQIFMLNVINAIRFLSFNKLHSPQVYCNKQSLNTTYHLGSPNVEVDLNG